MRRKKEDEEGLFPPFLTAPKMNNNWIRWTIRISYTKPIFFINQGEDDALITNS